MSKNRNKNNGPSDPTEEDSFSSGLVAIPKNQDQEPPQESAFREPAYTPEPSPPRQRSSNDSIGDLLRRTRIRRNGDLYQIAEYLRIKPSFLIALENNRYDEFPADAYVIGFLRTYANFLGIDGKEAVDRYRYEMAGRRKKPVLSMPSPLSEGRAPSAIVLIGAAVVLILIYSVWYFLSSADRDEARVPPALPSAQISSLPSPAENFAAGLTAPVTLLEKPAIPPASPGIVVTAEKPAAAEPPKEEPPPAQKIEKKEEPKPDSAASEDEETETDGEKPQIFGDVSGNARIVIRATQNSWIMIADDSGRTLFDRVLRPGESYKVPGQTGLVLTTSNGGGIVLSLDGKDLPKIAKGAPRMVRNIALDPDALASGSLSAPQ